MPNEGQRPIGDCEFCGEMVMEGEDADQTEVVHAKCEDAYIYEQHVMSMEYYADDQRAGLV